MKKDKQRPSWTLYPQRLYPVDEAALEYLSGFFGTSRNATVRSCIRGTAEKMGFVYNPSHKSE